MALEHPHYCSFLQHIRIHCKGSARPCEDPLATDWGKGEQLEPSEVAHKGLPHLSLLPGISDGPISLFWVSSFNELI